MSTQSSIAYIRWVLNGLEYDLHFYNDCFESLDSIYMDTFIQGEGGKFCYAVPKAELLKLTKQLVAWRDSQEEVNDDQ